MLGELWPGVGDGGPAFAQHWGNVSTSLCYNGLYERSEANIALCIDVFAGLCLPETLPVD